MLPATDSPGLTVPDPAMTGQMAVPVAIGAATAASWVATTNNPPRRVVSAVPRRSILRNMVTCFRVSTDGQEPIPDVPPRRPGQHGRTGKRHRQPVMTQTARGAL